MITFITTDKNLVAVNPHHVSGVEELENGQSRIHTSAWGVESEFAITVHKLNSARYAPAPVADGPTS